MHKQMEAILTRVQKPARYVGGEWGSVMKDKKNVDLRFAFCFPDTYEVAMSHLGSRILYGLLTPDPLLIIEQSVQNTRAKVRHRNLVSVRKAESEPQIYILFVLHHRSPFAADVSRRLLHPGQDGFHLFMQAVILQNEYSLVVSYEMY